MDINGKNFIPIYSASFGSSRTVACKHCLNEFSFDIITEENIEYKNMDEYTITCPHCKTKGILDIISVIPKKSHPIDELFKKESEDE